MAKLLSISAMTTRATSSILSGGVTVPQTTIDTALQSWSRLDFIKVDAEAHTEADIWDGMQETLRRFPSLVVAVELHAKSTARPRRLSVFSIRLHTPVIAYGTSPTMARSEP